MSDVSSPVATTEVSASDMLSYFVELYNQDIARAEEVELKLALLRSQSAADKREIDSLKEGLLEAQQANQALSSELEQAKAIVRNYNGLSQQMASMKIRHDNALAENKELKGTDNPARLRKQIVNLKKKNAEYQKTAENSKRALKEEEKVSKALANKVKEQHQEKLSLSEQLTIASVSALYKHGNEYLFRLPLVQGIKAVGETGVQEGMILAYTQNFDVWRAITLDDYDDIALAIPLSLNGKAESTINSVVRHLPNPSDELLDFARQWLIKVKRQNNVLCLEDLIAFQGVQNEA